MIDDGSILLDTSPSLIASMPKSKSYEIRYYYRGDDSIRSNYYDLERELSVDLPLLLVSLYMQPIIVCVRHSGKHTNIL